MKIIILAALAASAAAANAQSVAVLNVALYNESANIREATDSAKAVTATDKLRDTLARFKGLTLVSAQQVAAAAASAPAEAAAGGHPCNVIVACARAVGKVLGAPWVVMGKVSKTSNLIWVFSGELIEVDTGALILDDEFELKGDPDRMVPAGVGLFANRVNKQVGASSGAHTGPSPPDKAGI